MATALAARGDRINPAVSGRYCPSLPRYYIRVCYIAAASRSIALDKIKLIFSLYSLYSSFYLVYKNHILQASVTSNGK